MRKLIPVLAAAVLLAASPPAGAEPAGTAPEPVPGGSILLPTGDRVDALGAAVAFRPAPGREHVGYFSDPVPGGGLAVLPADVAGTADPRAYDISALLGAEPAPDRATPATAAAATPVTVSLRDRHGNAPDTATVYYADAAGDGGAFVVGPDGTGTLEIPPGEYRLLVRTLTRPAEGARGEFVGTARTFTVGEEPLALTVDGADATPLGAVADREAVTDLTEVTYGWTDDFSVGASMSDGTDMYLTPTDEPGVSVTSKHTLVNPGGPKAAHPFTYRLLYADAGIPDDLVHEVRTADLAAVTVDYGTLGVPWESAEECATSNLAGGLDGMCRPVPIVVPSTRTNYYLADVRHQSFVELLDPETGTAAGYTAGEERTYTPGSHRVRAGTGPLSAGVEEEGMFRYGDVLYFQPLLASNDQNSYVNYYGEVSPLTGTAVVTRDGVEVNRIDGDLTYFDTGLEPGTAGRYRLTVDAKVSAPWTDLATRDLLDWEFATAPGEPETYVPLPFAVVDLDTEGVRDGEAKRSRAQDVDLTFTNQPGTPDTTATSMTFEVSYDDGATWRKVAIKRDGDHATATLRHPAGAKYVSVRMSATDDAGTKVSHTTIRSYALV